MRFQCLWTSRKGTSLVEILVVMVVLLVGIMTVVQMFPTGFGVIKAAESRTIATRLAQQELERWKNAAANLPDGIEVVPEDENSLRMIGESTLIPVAEYFQTGSGVHYGSRYTLAFSPIYVTQDPNTGKIRGLSVKSGDLRRRLGDREESPPPLRAGEYAIDYELVEQGGRQFFHVAFPTTRGSPERLYYISYSYWASRDSSDPNAEWELFSKINQPVIIPPDPNGEHYNWVEVPVEGVPAGYALLEVERYSDTCARGFIEQPGNWTNDPYEYKLADPIMGVVAFNPTGHGKYEYTGRGIRPIEARIDYRVYDTRIIREDRVVPQPTAGAAAIPVKLSLRFILNIGDPTDNPGEEDGYKGLIINPGVGMAIPLPMLIMDLSTGLRIDLPNLSDDIDFKAGVVKLPIEADLVNDLGESQARVTLAGRHLRFYYRVDGDWSVRCHKAYSVYTRGTGRGDPDSSHDKSRFSIKPDSNRVDGLSNELLFHESQYGETVLVDYSYVTIENGERVEHKVSGEAHIVDVLSEGYGIKLNIPENGFLSKSSRTSGVGSSFGVKVRWRDGKNWREVDMVTSLVKS
ncbi:MAG: hypothetical protein N3B12_08865 [Armatimonadetes bacterium]|nr:hypothetical protein [Armatimonadota bacterium]